MVVEPGVLLLPQPGHHPLHVLLVFLLLVLDRDVWRNKVSNLSRTFYLESLHEDVEPFCFFFPSGRVEILVVYELCRSLFELLDLLGVKVFRYMDVVHGETPEGGAELGRHVLPHPGGEVRHHGLDDRGHHQLRRLRVLHMLLRHSPLLPQLVSLP